MPGFVIRRLIQSVLTVFGVMLLTFLLFNVIAGDISYNYVSPKAPEQQRQAWLKRHGLDKPKRVQFFNHLYKSVTFQGRSYATDQKLTTIIAHKAKYSLGITVPAMALGWISAMIISCVVAYYRDTWVDRIGVFLAVLGMCVPFLAYMVLGQWLMFQINPERAWGLDKPSNIYVPVLIAVVAGIGGSVRFYRTVFLDEIGRDYVRTARAKGVPLYSVLFSHVLKNCMLPILTNLVTAIPFLIMGSLLLERFFGVPGLGDLMLSSITTRDVPIITGLTFLTAVVYVVSLLVTDVMYAVFDPRIRLR